MIYFKKLKTKIKSYYHKYFSQKPKSLGYIFMLHRVDEIDQNKLWCNEHMKVTPDFLDKQLSLLKEKYDIISLTDVINRLKNPQKKKFIAFTMDDGYKDNLIKALPIFKKHNIPYTIFITTNFPNKTAILWWYELEDLLLNNLEIKLSNGKKYPAKTYEEKCDSFLKIREEILKLNQQNLEEELNNLFSNYKIDWKKKCDELCLSWNEIKMLKNESLVTIGGHTQNHYNLKNLKTENDVYEEIKSGLDELRNNANIETNIFAYPFGSANEASNREYLVSKRLGLVMSCIAYGGACTRMNKKNIYALPRIMLKNDFNIEELE